VATTKWFFHFPVIVDTNIRSSHILIDFPNSMVLPEWSIRNEITFEFGYIGYATNNDAGGDPGHSASIHNLDGELYECNGLRRNGALLKLDQSNVEPCKSLREMKYVIYFRT
jgi:hypothetical protein